MTGHDEQTDRQPAEPTPDQSAPDQLVPDQSAPDPHASHPHAWHSLMPDQPAPDSHAWHPHMPDQPSEPAPAPEPAPPDVDLDRVWLRVAAEVWRREPGWLERAAARLLRSPGLARALVMTPSLLLGWIIATALVLAVGALATRETGTPYVALLAPAIAAAGIAVAYGPGTDPAWELSCSMVVGERMVLLIRALTVFGLNAALGLAASAGSGVGTAVTFGWLVPMTAVCSLALAVATLARSANAGVAAGLGGWALAVLVGQSADGRLAPIVAGSGLILPYLAFAACCGAVFLYAIRFPRSAP